MKINKTQVIKRKIDMIEHDMQKQMSIMSLQTLQVSRAKGVSKGIFLMLPAIAFIMGWKRSFRFAKNTSKLLAFIFSTWARKQFTQVGYHLLNLASHRVVKKISKDH